MSWICPYCGYINENDPLNSHHTPKCGGCDEEYKIPDWLLNYKINTTRELKTGMHANNLERIEIHARIEFLKTELASEQIKLYDAQSENSRMYKELTKWERTKIYGLNNEEIDKAVKATLDPKQVKLPFEVLTCV